MGDMSEYMERHSVSRLIGAPPGYIGYDEGGLLTESIRRRPYQCILLDEIEKASREVTNVLLQVMDEGFLTDSHGRRVDFRNTIIIMTSNLGAKALQDLPDGLPASYAEEQVMDQVRGHFAPELLNRIDEVVMFDRLRPESMRAIVDVHTAKVEALALGERGINLEVSDDARNWLARETYAPAFGARPLIRALGSDIMNPLARKLLEGSVVSGDTVDVVVGHEGKEEGGNGELELKVHPNVNLEGIEGE